MSRGTLEKLGLKPGDMLRVTTRRGEVELAARQDDAIPDGVVFIPFAFVEAAANILTNPALDPFGKDSGIQILRGESGASGVEAASSRVEASRHSLKYIMAGLVPAIRFLREVRGPVRL